MLRVVFEGVLPRMRRAWISCIGLATCLGAVHASAEETHDYPACSKQASEAEVAGAKGAFQAGNSSFNEADYARAITYWEDAYRRDCSAHALLLNLSRAYELNGERAQAVIALRAYLDRVPRAPERASYERRIEALERQIEAEKSKPSPTPPAPPLPPPTTETQKVELPPPAKLEDDTRTQRPAWPLVVGAAGLVIAGVGIPVFIQAHNVVAAVERDPRCNITTASMPTPSGHQCADPGLSKRGNDARTRSAIGTGMIIGGGVLAGAGVLTYLIWPTNSGHNVGQSWQPILAPGLIGLGYSNTF